MTQISYFGYGSLVNRATHRTDIIDAVPARLSGWRRRWLPRPDMPFMPTALLTVRPDPQGAIDGLLVSDHLRNLGSLDAREVDYDRKRLDLAALSHKGTAPAGDIYIYEAREHVPAGGGQCPILQSYLDAVLQGFFAEFGERGVTEFVFETENFDIPILRDRDEPIYPRAVQLGRQEQELIDDTLAARGVTFVRSDAAA